MRTNSDLPLFYYQLLGVRPCFLPALPEHFLARVALFALRQSPRTVCLSNDLCRRDMPQVGWHIEHIGHLHEVEKAEPHSFNMCSVE